MATYLPQTLDDLRQISGFGPVRVKSYGKQFLQIVLDYCSKNNLSSRISEISPKRLRKTMNGSKIDTRLASLELYKAGKTIADIALERKLAVSTIESHMATFIETGEINVEELLDAGKLDLIKSELKEYSGGPITPIKEKLGVQVSFSEIRYAIAWKIFQKNSPAHVNH
jgi:ATP-dependent DNA helicase RecQ